MPNLFDGLQSAAFAVVVNTMGYAASWSPSAGGAVKTATVLFKDAHETAKLLEVEYDPRRAMIEYYESDFPGLELSANQKNDEFVTVKGTRYGVNDVKALYDGKTLFAELQESPL